MSEAQHHRLALPQGTRIRDFEFHRVLGHGRSGITYLGRNLALDIPVAIKEYLPADLATREQDGSVVPQTSQAVSDFQWGLERFLDEARTLARFQHPNIVRVHHFFEAHNTAYIAMEYAEGETLSAHLERKGSLSEAELTGILYPLLSALEVLHGADFLHRDIEPGNIVLRAGDGSPVLLDFGVARQAIGAKSQSVTSMVTPGYAPIEQYSSRGRQGPWTDIYALGGVCYRALTGQVPEDATDRMRDDPLVPVAKRCAGRVGAALLSAVDWALSVDEGARPQSVGAWRETMEGAAAPQQAHRQDEERHDTGDEIADAPVTAQATSRVEDAEYHALGQLGHVEDAKSLNRWFRLYVTYLTLLLFVIPIVLIVPAIFGIKILDLIPTLYVRLLLLLLLILLITISLLLSVSILRILHKLWSLIPSHKARTTLGKAVGFLFILILCCLFSVLMVTFLWEEPEYERPLRIMWWVQLSLGFFVLSQMKNAGRLILQGATIGDSTSEASHPLNALPQGYRLQEYELVRVLGCGGFGMTYLGFDHHLDKPVAIKEYLPSNIALRTADHSVAPQASEFRGDFQWGLEQFLDEARTLARFDHRHIIKVHRFFEAHGTAYIVMEYAEGETLSAHLERKGTLQEAELKEILYPLLDGLAVVHGADFLHRDIKPDNIVLRDGDGSPVLLDFGAARQVVGTKSQSVTSILTPGYAPIEQYSSRGYQGPWTDLYALGGVCYRALTGQIPDDATDRMRDDPLVPVAQRCAGRVSEAFLSAVDWALSVDAGDRPQSVGAWRETMGEETAAAEKEAVEDAPSAMDEETAAEKEAVEDAPSAGRVEQDAPPLERPHDPDPVLNDDELQRQEQAFVAEVGRKPSPKARSKGGDTDLHIAARLNLPVLARSLLTQGTEVNAKNNQGWTPLHSAAADAASMAKALLENGAAADAASMAKVLLENGADVYAKDSEGDTPLHSAAAADTVATAKMLLDNGADVNAKNNKGDTPLHSAAAADAVATAKMLLDNGADVNAKNNKGDTPLHSAAAADTVATAKMLLDNGADVNAKNNKGKPPLRWTTGRKTAEVLESYGGQMTITSKIVAIAFFTLLVVLVVVLVIWFFSSLFSC